MNYTPKPRAGLLIGHPAISGFLNLDPRDAAEMHVAKAIPSFDVGGFACCRRSQLEAVLRMTAMPVALPDVLRGEQIREYLGATSAQYRACAVAGLPLKVSNHGPFAYRADVDQWIIDMENARGDRQ